MPTPFDSGSNSSVSLSSHDYRIDALIENAFNVAKWGGAVGTGATITYSFPGAGSVWNAGYSIIDEPHRGLVYFTTAEQTAARAALQAWANIANINFVEVSDSAASVGDIRFARTAAMGPGELAHAYFPTTSPSAGDVWVRSDYLTGNDLFTAEGQQVLLHEIGHALGLHHPFDGPVDLPRTEDNFTFTVMSYTHGSGATPTTPQAYDVLAINYLYGNKGSSGAGVPGNYVLNGSTGNDILSGLTGNDTLKGLAGNDVLYGGGGNDFIDGGAGLDTAVFVGARSAYTVRGTSASMTVSGPDGFDQLLSIERLQFTDKKIAFDLGAGQNAGNAVRLIGAAFDSAYIPQLEGVGIMLFDAGLSMTQVAQRALGTDLFLSLAGSHSNVDFVNTVYRNVTGHLPGLTERDSLVGLLVGSGGTLTQADLLVLAANNATNTTANINLVGLQGTGLEYV